MSRDVAKFVKSCERCMLNKVKIGNKEPLCLTETPVKSFDKVIIDTIGRLLLSESGYKYAVTIICDLTKYVIAIAIPDKEAITVAKALMNHFILIFGIPSNLLSDLGTEYKNEIFSHLAEMLKMTHSISTAYRHETVGSVERNHRTFNEYLRAYLPERRHEWDQLLKYFLFAYNTTPNASFDLKQGLFT